MNYKDVVKQVRKTENLVIGCLPSFCGSNYNIAENLETSEKVYVLRDYGTDIITDVTKDFGKAVNPERANRNIIEILHNNYA